MEPSSEQTFLERKDLETKLAVPERNSVTLLVEENERLKLQLQKAATENEILRATSAAHSHHRSLPPLDSHGPMRYSPTDLYTNVLLAPENETPSHTIMTSDTGERLFAAGST
jgi:AP-1-like factor